MILKEIETLENKKFFLAMNDHWSFEDYQYNDELNQQIKKLREKL